MNSNGFSLNLPATEDIKWLNNPVIIQKFIWTKLFVF